MPRGTGDAVRQLQPLLHDFDGDLLILYGDTPLFSPASIRGLINRHRLRAANLTLLTAVADRPYPYGRVIRDSDGRIMDIIEEAQASARVREIRELNVGAYVVSARQIWPVLAALPPSPLDGEYRLTDLAHRLIHYGLAVESYQIYDQDEIQGVNTREDLERAEFILQKRLFRPRRQEERNIVTFGTGGWRAVIGEGFTLHNVRRLCQALANDITRRGLEARGVLIGYDRRFLSDRAAEAAAEVFAGNNIHTILLSEDAPTPLINYATEVVNAAFGLAFTASHNPPEWNGLKVFNGDGSLLLTEETNRVEDETNSLTTDDVVKIPLDIALEAGIVERRDFVNQYVDRIESFIDLDAIRKAGLKVIVDPMYGVGHLTLGIILNEARCRVTFIHDRHNPLFGGRSPAPDLEALRMLRTIVREEHYDLGLATDGDADRIALIDERGNFIHINDLLLLLYWYLHEVKGQRGGVVRNLATTHLLDRLAAAFGEKCIETPVGFKWIAAGMVDKRCPAGRRVQRRPDHPRPHPGQGRHLRLRADRRDAGGDRQTHLRAAGDRQRHHGPPLLGGGQPARHRRYAHHRPAARQGDDRRRGGALSGRQGRRLRRHQGLFRARQLGPAALLRHRAGAAHLRRGRYARKGAHAGGLAEAVRTGGVNSAH